MARTRLRSRPTATKPPNLHTPLPFNNRVRRILGPTFVDTYRAHRRAQPRVMPERAVQAIAMHLLGEITRGGKQRAIEVMAQSEGKQRKYLSTLYTLAYGKLNK